MSKEMQSIYMVPGAGTMVVGAQYVSTKLTALAQHMLWEMPDYVESPDSPIEHNVLMVVFDTEKEPTDTASRKPALSMWYSDTRTVVLYLRNIIEDVWKVVSTRKNRCSANMLLWDTKVRCLLHELRHSAYMLADDGSTPIGDLEKDAYAWTEAMMAHLAKWVDIEPPALADMPWLGAQAMGRFIEATKSGKSAQWVGLQQELNEKKLLFLSPRGQKTVTSFRAYHEARAIDKGDILENWKAKPIVPYFTGTPLDVLAAVLTDINKPKEAAPAPAPMPAAPIAQPSAGAPAPPPSMPAAQPPPPPPAQPVASGLQYEDGPEEIGNEMGAEEPAYTEENHEPVNYSPAAGGRTAYKPLPPPQVVPNGLAGAQIVPVLHSVYVGCWTHIFSKCGQLANSDQAFANPGAVLERISFGHIPGFDNIITHMDCSVINQQTNAPKWTAQVPVTNGVIWGHVSKEGMPMYSLYVNVNGTVVRRLLMPTKTTGTGKLSIGARKGERHMLVMDADKPKGAQGAVIGVVSTGVNGAGYYRSFS